MKDIFKATSVYTLLGFLPVASRIFVLPVFLKFLDITDFAFIGLNSLIAGIVPVLMTLGLEHAYARHYFDYKQNPSLLRSYTSTILIMIILQSVVFFLLFYPFGDSIFRALFESERFTFSAFGVSALLMAILFSVNSLINVHLRSKKAVGAFALFSGGQFLLSLAAESIAIIVFKAGAEEVIWVRLGATGFMTFAFLIYMFIANGISFESRFLGSSFHYAMPMVPYTACGLIFAGVDRVLLENMDVAALGAFNLAMAIAHITDSFMFALQSATYPTVYELFKQDMNANADKINRLYRLIGIAVLVVICGLIAAAPVGIYGFLNEGYFPAVTVIPLILIGYAFRYLYIVYAEPLFFFKQTQKLPWMNVLSGIVSLVANLVLVPLAGIFGAAIASVLSKASQFSLSLHWYRKDQRFTFRLEYLVPLVILLMVSCTALSLIHYIPAGTLNTAVLFCLPLLTILLCLGVTAAIRLRKNSLSFSFSNLARII